MKLAPGDRSSGHREGGVRVVSALCLTTDMQRMALRGAADAERYAFNSFRLSSCQHVY